MLVSTKKYDNIITFERKPEEMATEQGSDTNKKETDVNNGTDRTEGEKKNSGGFLKHVQFFGELCAILIVLYGVVSKVMIPISQHEENIKDIKEELEEIDDSLDELTKLTYLGRASSDNNGNASAIPVVFSEGYVPKLEFENNSAQLSNPSWIGNNEKIAKALGNEKIEYTSGELQNKRFVTMYEEGDKEIYFLGKYNEDNHWDGECVLNVYNNNELIAILEGIYDNGKLGKYKRIACDENGKWTFTDREAFEGYTDGETWNYEKKESIEQKIEAEHFDETGILGAEQVLDHIDKKIISYYKGKTSKGSYNSQNEEACLVLYDEDGNVRYLYVGQMKDGKEYDDSGKAWSISWGYGNDGYYYYEGVFEGRHGETPEDWKPMTSDEIKKKVNPDDFACPLTGLIGKDI